MPAALEQGKDIMQLRLCSLLLLTGLLLGVAGIQVIIAVCTKHALVPLYSPPELLTTSSSTASATAAQVVVIRPCGPTCITNSVLSLLN